MGLGVFVHICFRDHYGDYCVNPEHQARLASTFREQVVALAQTNELPVILG